MNPNQPDPMRDPKLARCIQVCWSRIGSTDVDNVQSFAFVSEQALRAISLEKAINNLVRDLDDQISILESRHADTGLSGPTRIGASHRARDLREWRDSVAALAKPRAAGGEENENG